MGEDLDLLQLRQEAYDVWKAELLVEWGKLTHAQQMAWGRRHSEANQKKAAVNDSLEAVILERDYCTCRYCGKPMNDKKEWQIDHVHPFSKGGETTMENLVTACKECNRAKLHLHGIVPLSLELIQQNSRTKQEALRASKLRRAQLHRQWKELLNTQNQNDIEKHFFFYRFDVVIQGSNSKTEKPSKATTKRHRVSALDQVYDIDTWIERFIAGRNIQVVF
jgi:hypothetical protein